MKKFLLLNLLISLSLSLFAQESMLTGTVTDAANGQALPGASVVVKGTTNGTITDFDGKFTLSLKGGEEAVVVSFMGYQPQEVKINGRQTITVALETDSKMLGDVVVTALGIAKEEKKLAYAVAEVKSKDLTTVKDANVAASISGKVAGVQIQKTAGGPGGSANVIIRGYSSLIGNNQPLYIVDGVPIDNSSITTATTYWDGGIDYGDGIGDVNADDIASLTVLKGPSAAALYGSRAANGVIIINTKTGEKTDGIGVEYTGNFTWETPLVLPNFQNEYGVGSGGELPADVTRIGPSLSWGPKMNGQNFTEWNGETRSLVSQSNNIKDFFETGFTATNSVALSGGTEKSDYRLSISNLTNDGMVPTSEFDRTTLNFRGRLNPTDKFSIDTKISYINSEAHNRPYMAETMENPMHFFLNSPRSVSLDDLRNNYIDAVGNPVQVINETTNAWHINPYFALNKSPNWDEKDRLITMVAAKYKFNDWVTFQARNGIDYFTSDRYRTLAKGTTYNKAGRIIQDLYKVREGNTDILFTGAGDLMDGLNLSYTLGGNMRNFQLQSKSTTGSTFNDYDWLHLNNTQTQTSTENYSEKQVNSVYGALSFAYKSMLYLDVTARNDWSSALPEESFFYPSVSAAWAFSELIENEDILSFGKIRASWAQVGNDTDPYRDATAFGYSGNYAFIGSPHVQWVPNPTVGNKLDPEQTTSIELGADLRFFQERLGLDFAWYNASTTNQILPTTVSFASGAQSTVINAGEIKNTGVEFRLYGSPVKTENFEWELGFNFSRNRNEVIELMDGVDQHQLSSSNNGRGQISIEASPGQPYGNIVGYDYKRDTQGRIIIDNGVVQKTDDRVVLGNITPDWTGGLLNRIRYKNIELRALIDISVGGEMFSSTNFLAYRNGNHQGTVEGRENGLAVNAVDTEGNAINKVGAEDYWLSVTGQDIATDFVYDASYIKFRELSIGYALPNSLLQGTFIKGLNVAVTARNLFFIKNGMDGIDPESTISRGMLGVEYAAIPSARSFGFNVYLNF